VTLKVYSPDNQSWDFGHGMKIGIVGCGMISGHHLNAATRYRGAQVIGLVDRDIARARAQAERFGVAERSTIFRRCSSSSRT